MIVRERPGQLRLLFIFRGSVIERIYPRVLAIVVISALVVWGHRYEPNLVPSVIGAPFTLIGIALSVFLGFRNNACYDRWWEARKTWGHLATASRDLARQTILIGKRGAAGAGARARLLHLNIVFAEQMVRHLRDRTQPNRNAEVLLSQTERQDLSSSKNPPDYLLRLMGSTLADLRDADVVSDVEFALLDRTIGEHNAAMTACERLLNTPVPFGYTLLLHRTAYLFCYMLPFGFADILGPVTPFAAGMVAYAFFGLDALSEELEEPFGTLPNALPIAAIAKAIEINLRDALGETDLPAMPEPVGHILQ